jgi:predicted O-methyltransferase YrrM
MRVLGHFLRWRLGLAQPQSWPEREEGYFQFLRRYAEGRRRLVEIGCWQGVSTFCLRQQMASEGVLYAVDSYEPGRLGFNFSQIIAHHHVNRLSRGRVIWLRHTEAEASRILAGQEGFDFILIDHVPSYEAMKSAWENWSDRVIPGGVILALGTGRHKISTNELPSSYHYGVEVMRQDRRYQVVEQYDQYTAFLRLGDLS